MATNRFLMAGLVLILALCGYAQQGSTGSISGSVTDGSGRVVPNATVKLTSERSLETRDGTTNEAGDFFFAAVVPGAYTVRIEAPGFRRLEQKGNILLTSAGSSWGNWCSRSAA